MTPMKPSGHTADCSNGYEAKAAKFRYWREQSVVGCNTVRRWAMQLPAGGTVLDLGCGSGLPLGLVLQQAGLQLYGVDASPSLVAAFRRHLPMATVACESVEQSGFFGRCFGQDVGGRAGGGVGGDVGQRFDGALAVGLLFLLPPASQLALFAKVAAVLEPGGRFLCSAPSQSSVWQDLLTGQRSESLGAVAYQAAAKAAGLTLLAEYQDSGGNHYFDWRY